MQYIGLYLFKMSNIELKVSSLYSVRSLSPGCDIARLFDEKRSPKSCTSSEIAHTQQRVCAHAYKLRLCSYVTARR